MVVVCPALIWTVWGVSSNKNPSLALVSLTISVRAGLDALDQDGPRGIGDEVAVAVTHYAAVALRHKELNIEIGELSALDTFLIRRDPIGLLPK